MTFRFNAAKLAKIRRIAEDTRADPFTREIAQRMLSEHTPPGPRNTQHPGLRQSDEYKRFKRANESIRPK